MERNSFACALQSRLPLLVVILCMIQPVMDVLSYWIAAAEIDNTITLLLRLCILVLMVLVGICLSEKRWVYLVTAAVLVLLTAGHVGVCLYYGYQDPMGDLTNLVRIYQMPLTVLSFITYIRREPRCLDAVKWGFLGSFALVVVVEILATVTGTDPHTYANKAIGVLGWFAITSAQSAIISMVIPVAILCVMEWKKLHPVYVAGIGVVGLGVLYLFATRLSYAALLGTAFGLACSCLLLKLLKKERTGKPAVIFAVLGLAAVLLVGLSPMEANNEKVAENARLKQEDILMLVEADTKAAEAAGLTGLELKAAGLKSAYEKYLPGVTGRFGLERTAEYYNYTTDVVNLSNTRLQKQSYSLMLMQDQPLAALFGLELYDLTYDGITYDAENDFHGIYFLCGGVGLVLMIAFIAFFLLRIAAALIRDFKYYFTLPAAGFGIALICGLAHAYFTAGVLRRPNSNFYLAVLLAAVFVLTERRKNCNEENTTMVTINRLRTRVTDKLPLLVLVLLIIQPLMDVLSFWMAEWKMSNSLTLALRMLVLAVMVLAGFWLSHKKKVYFIAAAICAFIGLGHMFASWQFGYQNIVSDLSNYIRVLQLPLTVLCLITFFKENDGCYDAMKKGIAINLTIILAVQVLAVVTGTEPHTYDDGRGLIGWFANTNTQSAIVTMAGPAAVAWLYQRKGLKSIWLWIALIGSGFSMYYLGTRLAYAGIVAMCFGLGVSMIIVRLKDWKKAVALLLVGVVFIGLVPLSPMMGHQGGWSGEMGDKQGWADVMIQQPTEPGEPIEPIEPDDTVPLYDPELVANLTEEEWAKIQRLAPAYEHFVSDFVAIFGVERTIVMFDYTEDITVMTHNRTKKLMVAEALMDISLLSGKLFGVELDRFTIKGHIYDVENDFHGIYYLYGIVGLAALLLFLAYFLFLIVKGLIQNFKRYFTLEAAGWGIALIMALTHCYFTASILRRPSASFYLAAVLAGVYYLLKIKKYPEGIEG